MPILTLDYFSTAIRQNLSPFLIENVMRATKTSSFSLNDFRDGKPISIYIVVPSAWLAPHPLTNPDHFASSGTVPPSMVVPEEDITRYAHHIVGLQTAW